MYQYNPGSSKPICLCECANGHWMRLRISSFTHSFLFYVDFWLVCLLNPQSELHSHPSFLSFCLTCLPIFPSQPAGSCHVLYSVSLPCKYRASRTKGVLWFDCIIPRQVPWLSQVSRNKNTYAIATTQSWPEDSFPSLCLNWDCCKHCLGPILSDCSTSNRNMSLYGTCSKAKVSPLRIKCSWEPSCLNTLNSQDILKQLF